MTAPTDPRLPGGGTPHPNPPRIGSLFSGYGGLDMAVRRVLGGRLAWVSDIDPGACAVLAHHHPDVPNLGDVSAIDWTAVEPVDVLTGGFPCQDVSLAGRRAGLVDGTRSGLWTQMARAIDELRPALVVIENVRGLCSAPAHSDLEPCPWCVGDDQGVPLRALGAVLGDLADRGYDAQWCGLRAADVGAPHGRFRVFILAWRRDLAAHAGHGTEPERARQEGRETGEREAVGCQPGRRGGVTATDAESVGHGDSRAAGGRGVAAAPVAGGERGAAADPDRGGLGADQRDVRTGQPDADRRSVAHTDGLGHERHGDARDGRAGSAHHSQPASDTTSPRRGWAGSFASGTPEGTPAETGGPVGRGGSAPARSTAAHPDGARQQQRARDVTYLARRADDRAALTVNWGIYGPGIQGWEHALGRSAPAPRTWSTSYRRALQARLDGRNRKPVGMRGSLEPQYSLNPVFVEWLMGLPAGWVTDVPGLTPNQMLRLLGNGVVPQQGTAALTYLLDQAPAFVHAWLATRHLSAAAA